MRFRILGRTGLKVSEIGFGCWAIGGNAYGPVRDEDSLGALEASYAAGVNLFDTADVYGEGHSELLLGRFLKDKPRDGIVLATKGGWDFTSGAHRKNFSPDYLRRACEQSLERLGTDHVDLYQLHNPSLELIRSGDAVSTVERLKKEGKVRAIGISVHTEAEALAALADERVGSLQLIFNILDQRMAANVFAGAARRSTGLIVREPLASGLLTGKYPPGHEFPKNDHRRRWDAEKREWDWERVQILRKATGWSNDALVQGALEFVLSFSEVSSAIPGAKTKEQITAGLRASFSPRLAVDDITLLKKIYADNAVFRKGLLPR